MRSKFLKRVGAWTLGIALFVSALSMTALTQTVTGWAKDYTDEQGVQYRVLADSVFVFDYKGTGGANGYVRWVSSNPSVLKVTQASDYTQGFQLDAPKSGTVWLKAKNSKGKVIAQYKVRVKAK